MQKIADNWHCANALEHFKQKVIDPHRENIKKGEEYINGGYEKICKEKNKVVDTISEKFISDHLTKAKKRLKEQQLLLTGYETIYVACYTLIQRHEGTINELSSIYVELKENLLWKGEMPSQLMGEQVKIMNNCFESIEKILEPCKLYEK